MLVRFWGVRGSVPWATPAAMEYRMQYAVRRGPRRSDRRLPRARCRVGPRRPERHIRRRATPDPAAPVALSLGSHARASVFRSPLLAGLVARNLRAGLRRRSRASGCRSLFQAPNFPVPFEHAAQSSGDALHSGADAGDRRLQGRRAAAHASGRGRSPTAFTAGPATSVT